MHGKYKLTVLGSVRVLGGVLATLMVGVQAQLPPAQIVFHSNRNTDGDNKPDDYEIYVMDARGRDERRLTDNPDADDQAPA